MLPAPDAKVVGRVPAPESNRLVIGRVASLESNEVHHGSKF